MADGSVTIEVELTKEQLEKGLKSIKSDLGKLEKSNNNISDKLSKGFNNLGNVSVKAGKKLTLGLTTPLIALGTAGIKYNAQMEDFEANLTTLLGSADKAKEMLSSLKEMANTTPFETADLLESTQMMLGFGLAADKTQGYLKTLGDISMGNKEKLLSLTRAFSQMGASGKATMEDINQMIDAGFNPLQIMAETTGKSMATLRDEVSKGKISFEDVSEAMKIATSEGGRYYKAMEKSAGTMNGKFSTAIDALKTALGELTSSLLPIVTKVVERITEWANAFSNLDKKTQENILKFTGLLVVLGPILSIVGKMSSGISVLIKGFTTIKGAISLLSGPVTGVTTAMKVLSAVIGFIASPIGLVVVAVMALIGVLVYLWNTNEGFRNAVINIWNAIKETFSNVVNSIVTFFTETIPNAWNQFVTGLQNLGTTIWNTLTNVWNSIVSFFTEGIPNFINSVIQWFQELPYKIGYFIGQILGNIIKFGQNAWNWVTVELPKIIQGIIDWFKQLPGKIWTWLVNVVTKIGQWGQNMWNKATTAVSNMINGVINWFKQLPRKNLDMVNKYYL